MTYKYASFLSLQFVVSVYQELGIRARFGCETSKLYKPNYFTLIRFYGFTVAQNIVSEPFSPSWSQNISAKAVVILWSGNPAKSDDLGLSFIIMWEYVGVGLK